MKKSIILLITLLFISVISLLILKNLDDSKKYLDNVDFDYTLTQLIFSSKNIKNEIKEFVRVNKNKLDYQFEETPVIMLPPISIKDIKANISLEKLLFKENKIYSNINYLTNDKVRFGDENQTNNDLTNKYYKDMFYKANVNDYYRFVEFFDEFRKSFNVSKNQLLNYKQIQDIINIYKQQNDDSEITKISNSFYALNITQDTIKCNVKISFNDITINESYILNKEDQEITQLEFIIKK